MFFFLFCPPQRTHSFYHTQFCLSSTFFKTFFSKPFWLMFCRFQRLSYLITFQVICQQLFSLFFNCCFSDACHEQLIYSITFKLICQRLFSSFFKIFCRLCSLHDDYYIRLISFLQVFFLLISIFFLSYSLFVN